MSKKNCAQNNRLKMSKENIKSPAEEETPVTLTFTISTSLRNAFKAKIGGQGKKIKDVLIELIEEYVKN